MNLEAQVPTDNSEMISLTADIVSSYVSNNTVAPADLPALISSVQQALMAAQAAGGEVPKEAPTPAVSIRRSVTPDYIICLEDGKRFKSLKRHLATHHGMSAGEYRERWGLPADYPMVAPNYAAARSEMAKKIGLGQKRTAAAAKPKAASKAKAADKGGSRASKKTG